MSIISAAELISDGSLEMLERNISTNIVAPLFPVNLFLVFSVQILIINRSLLAVEVVVSMNELGIL